MTLGVQYGNTTPLQPAGYQGNVGIIALAKTFYLELIWNFAKLLMISMREHQPVKPLRVPRKPLSEMPLGVCLPFSLDLSMSIKNIGLAYFHLETRYKFSRLMLT